MKDPWADPLVSQHDGRIYFRRGRWRFFSTYGKRCPHCRGGVLWIKRLGNRRQIAIEPESWKGEEWFVSGKHLPHIMHCKGMRDQAMGKFKRKKVDPGLIL